jgi:peptide/nickel transport system permease protein
MAVSLPVGGFLGLTAGYSGGAIDALITRSAELFMAVPRFFLALAAIAVLGPGTDKLIVILSITSWPFLCRTLRAETLSLRERGYVSSARAAGARSTTIVIRHIIPQVMPRALVVLMLMGSRLILIEAGLAFLGLGDRSHPSLGVLASESQPYLREAWWLSVFPGLAIAMMALGLNLLSDGLGRAMEVESGAPATGAPLDETAIAVGALGPGSVTEPAPRAAPSA